MAAAHEQLEYLLQKASNIRLSKGQEEHLPTLNTLNVSLSESVKMSADYHSNLTKLLHHS